VESCDLNLDGSVTEIDRDLLVEVEFNTYYGDANLDGQFDSSDFVTMFVAGQYEDGILENSNWSTGDFNGDKEFNSSDFVLAFQGGGYERGFR